MTKPKCKCGKICAYYGSVGGYSVRCVECNATAATRQRLARRKLTPNQKPNMKTKLTSNKITLSCPRCNESVTVPKHSTDPKGTVKVSFPCPPCEDWSEAAPAPRYYGVRGMEIEV